MIFDCPFCLSSNGLLGDPQPQEVTWNLYGAALRRAVVCPQCGARGPAELSDKDAIAAWNKAERAEEDEED
jgi:hypothetical protein